MVSLVLVYHFMLKMLSLGLGPEAIAGKKYWNVVGWSLRRVRGGTEGMKVMGAAGEGYVQDQD